MEHTCLFLEAKRGTLELKVTEMILFNIFKYLIRVIS